ncbi:capsid and scaffold protein [Streptococcus phage CHPC873]|uniref:Capsid and scaffold protein n=1 Tax=Streptococcus phage CHPC873 TaxID=2365042 RepID=A0A3G8F9P6_9CAUD|nr:capsid and scaffold protein [Streptococcus phage CHPC873]AZF90622.1 capsid and scaffold protein [Streptococcus phage CHPC873]
MQIWIHDKSMRKVCALNNNVPGMLPYSNSQWHTYLEYSTSTFDFVIPKIVNGKLHDDLKYINDQMYVSFYYDNSYHVFYVSQLVENDFSFQVTCNNTNLELAAEIERPLASVDGAKTLEWYLQTLDLLGFAGLEVGFNEIPDRTRTITFESQNGTKLEQLHSLMNQFDAEFVFRTDLNRDGTLKKFVIDIYHRPDENHHGIGKVRGGVTLYYQTGLKGVQVSSDKTQLFNAGYFVGKDGLTLGSVVFEEKNELGQVEFYSFKDSPMVYAPLSADKYPSAIGGANEIDRWTRRDFQTEYSDVDSLKAYALRTIKQYAYPLMTYTVDVNSSFVENYKDINLGDTIKIVDNNFRGGLALEARVSEMIISFDNPTNNSVVFTNFRKLDNKPSSGLQQRIDEIVYKSLPYHVEIRTTNGTVFKNGVGHSTVKPILKQGDKIVNATYRFVIDGSIVSSGLTYTVKASDITKPTVVTISAWVDNKEVASEEITFLNVSDGKQGPKGVDGKTQYTHIAYANSADGSKDFSTSDSNREYIGIYVDFNANDSTNPKDYSWTLVKGADGAQGIPGKPGADGRTQYTHIAYADTISGSGFSQTDVNKAYIGMYQDFNAIDSQNPQDYRWSKWKGSDGKDGIPGKAGADGRTPYVHFAYADSADGRTGFSLTQTGSKRYLGVCTDFNQADSTNPADYTWNDTAGSVSVGGENLIINSAFPKNLDNWGFWETGLPNENLHIATHVFYYNGARNLFRLDNNGKEEVPAASRRFKVKRNTDYSFNIQTFATGNIKGLTIYFLGRKANETDKTFTKVVHLKTHTGSPSVTQSVKWHLTFNSGDCDEGFIRIDNNGTTDGNTSMLFFAELDCYEGTTDRSWQASPEDLKEYVDTKADNALTQAQLNKLNEINSVMKAEYEAKASLDTVNKWIKAYQDFVNANSADRAQAQKALSDASARVVKLENNLNDMSERWNFIDNYMAASNDGFVIGKKDNSSSIMFNPNGRISMFSAGNEVMYISKGVIHIENGIFSKTIQIGRYREEQDLLNPDRNVIRYVGGA